MGCFDTLKFLNGAPTCAAGHPISEVQTKDLGEMMRTFYIFDGRAWIEPAVSTPSVLLGLEGTEPLRLRLTRTTVESFMLDISLDGDVIGYDSCERCDPVCTGSDAASWNGGVTEHRPWCEWIFLFELGRLVKTTPVRLQTRDDVRKGLTDRIGDVLPDDDRVVKRILAKNRARFEHD